MGKAAVDVETGNQPTGYLTRPLGLTTASDESVQEVAQDICDNVKRGSIAKVTFVEKVPGAGPLDLSSRGRYRYDCEVEAPAAAPPRTLSAKAPAPAPAVAPAVASKAPAPSPSTEAVAGGTRDGQQTRACVLQQGVYHVCLGRCMLDSSSPPEVVAAECDQRCALRDPAGCK